MSLKVMTKSCTRKSPKKLQQTHHACAHALLNKFGTGWRFLGFHEGGRNLVRKKSLESKNRWLYPRTLAINLVRRAVVRWRCGVVSPSGAPCREGVRLR